MCDTATSTEKEHEHNSEMEHHSDPADDSDATVDLQMSPPPSVEITIVMVLHRWKVFIKWTQITVAHLPKVNHAKSTVLLMFLQECAGHMRKRGS